MARQKEGGRKEGVRKSGGLATPANSKNWPTTQSSPRSPKLPSVRLSREDRGRLPADPVLLVTASDGEEEEGEGSLSPADARVVKERLSLRKGEADIGLILNPG